MSDDFDFDDFDDDDFGDFGDISGPNSPNDDRKPLTKIASTALDEFKSKENAMMATKAFTKKALPDGYSNAYDSVVDVKDDVVDIYDKTLRELEPGIRQVKQLAAKGIPTAEKLLPKKLVDKLKSAIAIDEPRSRETVDPNEAVITETLKGIFDAEQTARVADDAVRTQQLAADRDINKQTAVTTLKSQDQQSQGISRLVGYQDTVLSKFHRKSLELQHRQFFAARDLLALTKASTSEISTQLQGILSNTGLPDNIKLRNSEEFAKISRERLLGSVQENVQRRLSGIPRRLKEGLLVKGKEAVSSFNANIEGLGALSEAADDGMGGGATDTIGREGASLLQKGLIEKYGAKTAGVLAGVAGVKAVGDRLQFESDNLVRGFNTKVQESESGIFSVFKDILGTTAADQESVVDDLQSTATEISQWDNISRRTLIEIIPGYLSRQLEQLTNIATGTTNDRIIFDSKSEQFSTVSTVSSNIKKDLVSELDGSLQRTTDDLLNSIDPDQTLSRTARTDLAIQLTKRSASGLKFDPVFFSKPDNIVSSESDAIAQVFTERYGVQNDVISATDATTSDRLFKSGNLFNRAGNRLGNYSEELNELVSTGDKESLRKIGAITNTDGSDQVSSDFKWNLVRDILEGTVNTDVTPDTTTSVSPVLKSVTPDVIGITPEQVGPTVGNVDNSSVTINADTSTLEDLLSTHAIANKETLLGILEAVENIGSSTNGKTKKTKASMLRKAYGKLKGSFGTGFKLSKFTTTKLALPGLKSLMDMGRKTLSSVKQVGGDIFVKGEMRFPKITKVKLVAGDYYDATTKKVITSFKDIKGAVVDRDGNIVLSAEEYTKGLVHRTGDVVEGLGSRVGSGLKGLLNKQLSISGFGIKGLGNLTSTVSKFMDRPRDVYIPGVAEPRLLKTGFVDGIYYSLKTKRVLRGPKDIDGPVVDRDGNIILSEQDLSLGITNVFGVPFTIRGLFNKVKSLSGALLAKGSKLVKKSIDVVRSSVSKITNKVQGKLDSASKESEVKSARTLEKIYRHLQLALPIRKAGLDADGFRVGGFKAQMRDREEEDEVETTTNGTKESKRGGIFGKLSGLGKGLFGKKDKKKDEDDGGILDSIPDVAKLGIGGLLSGALTSAAGAVTGGIAATGGLLSGALASVGSGIAGLGAAASGSGGAAATAGLVSNPIGWAILAGAAAYAGYKGIQYLSRRGKLEPLEKLRFLQYGIPVDNMDAVVAIRYLESEIDGDIDISNEGVPSLDMSPDDTWDTFASDFGADVNNPIHKQSFLSWFHDRFIPVFVTHRVAALQLGDVDVMDVDDELDNKAKMHYVNRTRFGDRQAAAGMVPYAISDSPWPDIALVDNMAMISNLSQQITAASKRNDELDLDNESQIKGVDLNIESVPTSDANKSNVVQLNAHMDGNKSALAKQQSTRNAIDNRKSIADQEAKNKVSMTKERAAQLISATKASNDGAVLINPAEGRLSSPFGTRTHPIKARKGMHKGIDIAAPTGTPIYASASGIFERVGISSSYGKVIYIRHEDGRMTRYAHMSGFGPGIVPGKSVGMPVVAGELIGYVGSTGNSTGPHLHFEYRENDGVGNKASVLNPVEYFAKAESDIADDSVAETVATDEGKTDSIGSDIVPVTKTPPSIVPTMASNSGATPAIIPPILVDTEADAVNRKRDVAASNALAGKSNIVPNVSVAAPNIDGVNNTLTNVGDKAAVQRDQQVILASATNDKLDKLLEALITSNPKLDNRSNTATQPIVNKPTMVKPVVNLTKVG